MYPDPHSYIPRSGDPVQDEKNRTFAALRRVDSAPKAEELISKAAAAGKDGINSFDPISGKSLIHFAVRSGATGLGNDDKAAHLVTSLIAKGARADVRCKHANMLPIHYAAALGAPKVIHVLAQHKCDIDGLAPSFDGGTALHLACSSLSVDGVLALIEIHANPFIANDRNRTPLKECEIQYEEGSDDLLYDEHAAEQIIEFLKTYMENERDAFVAPTNAIFDILDGVWRDKANTLFDGGKIEIKSNGHVAVETGTDWTEGEVSVMHGSLISLNIGGVSRVFKYFPAPNEKLMEHSADGSELTTAACLVRLTDDQLLQQSFVELDELDGFWEDQTSKFANGRSMDLRSDGSVVLVGNEGKTSSTGTVTRLHDGTFEISLGKSSMTFSYDSATESLVEVTTNSSLIKTGGQFGTFTPSILVKTQLDTEPPKPELPPIEVGDRVLVNNKKVGIVRYKGETHFNPGVMLYGIALKHAEGKHDGTVLRKTYFKCQRSHGTFATRQKLKLLSPEAMEDTTLPQKPARRPSRQVSKINPNIHGGRLRNVVEPAPFSRSTLVTRHKVHAVHGGVAKAPEQYKRRAEKLSPIHGAYSRPGSRQEGSPMPTLRRGMSRTFSSNLAEQDARKARSARRSRSKSPSLIALGAESFGIGSKVLADKKEMGTVKYVGGVHFAKGMYIGVVLEGPGALKMGEHDGMVDGRRYFSCNANVGILLPTSKVTWRGRRVSEIAKTNT